jgi:endonuclease/exonuclease/phosphatase family metal-dependent hydrolase
MNKKLIFAICLSIFSILHLNCTQKVTAVAQHQNSVSNLKVLSYNIHHANPPSKVGLIDLAAIAKVIKDENPDLVGLQEVDRFTKRSGNVDQAKLLAELTGLHYQFFKAIDHDGGDYGVAILSKFPIMAGQGIALPQVIKAEARVLSYATIKLANNQQIVFANTHLDATKLDSNRVAQMNTILGTFAKEKRPIILIGDLNCEAAAEPIRLLDRQFSRSCKSDCAFTIPQDKPRKTIDYIALKNADWTVKSHTVIPEIYASDHRPVVTIYQIK